MAWVRKRRAAMDAFATRVSTATRRSSSAAAGTFSTERQALRAATKAEAAIEAGTWFDVSAGKVTFRTYALEVWWPSLHVELTTKAAYRSNLETHFLPFFGDMRMANILPSHVQAWVNQAVEGDLTPRSVVKYHVVLHSIFRQAVRDRIIPFNPAAETKLPKVVRRQRRILTPQEFEALLEQDPRPVGAAGPHQHRDRPALGRTRRAAPATRRLGQPPHPRRGDRPRALQAQLPHRRSGSSSRTTRRTTNPGP